MHRELAAIAVLILLLHVFHGISDYVAISTFFYTTATEQQISLI